MSRSRRNERREPVERPLPGYVPTPEPTLDEVTEARLKRDFPLEEYPLATSKDLVVTPSGRVIVHVEGDDLITVGQPYPPLRVVK